MQAPQLLTAALLMAAISPAQAVVGPQYHEHPDDDTPKAKTRITATTTVSPKPAAHETDSVDQIKGIGQFKFGSKVTDYPNTLLQIVDPRAKGVLLRVCPYGQNYLVTDVKNLTWGGVPLKGLILTFNQDSLIDFQIALKGKKSDLYVARQAFKDKYGPSDPTTYPVQTWTGSKIQVTLVFPGSEIFDAKALDTPGQGKVELLDLAKWKKVEADKEAALKKLLQQRYEAAGPKVKDNL